MSDQATYALTIGLAMTLVLGGLGFLLKLLIWTPKTPTFNKIDHGKLFASNFVFFAALASGHFFVKSALLEAILQMVVIVTIFGIAGFLLGILHWTVVKEKKWSLLIWTVSAIAILGALGDQDFGDDDMYFSMKYALLYTVAGFVASAYHLKEGESAKVVVIGGLALCVLYTISTYGLNYGILTVIEYAVGYGLAQLMLKKDRDAQAPRNSDGESSSYSVVEKSGLMQVDPATDVAISFKPNSTNNLKSESKTEIKSNAFWIFMAVVVMSSTALFIKLVPEKKFSVDIELPKIEPTTSPTNVTPELPQVGTQELPTIKNAPPKLENIYLEIDREFMAAFKNSTKVMVIKVALMTQYDSRVFDNVKKNEFAIRRAILTLMENTNEYEVLELDFRVRLAEKMKSLMNDLLEKNEGFGGVDDVFFTSFVLQ